MIKIIPPDAYDFGEPPVRLVKLARDGLGFHDRRALVKHASEGFAAKLARLERKPGDEVALNIALSTTEAVGPNRNGDGFRAEWCRRNHDTFRKHAKAFRSHINRDDSPYYGRVKLSHFNEDMQRIELGVVYNGTKAAAERNGGLVADLEMEKLASGDVFPSSMACLVKRDVCLRAGSLVETASGLMPIEAITAGQLVRTHTGEMRPVRRPMSRPYFGEMISLRIHGMASSLSLTASHPIYIVPWAALRDCRGAAATGQRKRKRTAAAPKRRHTYRGGDAMCTTCRTISAARPEWVAARDVRKGDFAVYPVQPPGEARVGASLAYLAGLYSGDGCPLWRRHTRARIGTPYPAGITVTLDNATPAVIALTCEHATRIHGREYQPVHPSGGGRNSSQLPINNRKLGEFCLAMVGSGSKTKRIDASVFSWCREDRLQFLAGALDSDGSVDRNKRYGCGRHTTTNLQLANDLQRLWWGLGVPAAVHKEVVKKGYTPGAVVYIVSLSRTSVAMLDGYAAKADGITPGRYECTRAFLRHGYMHFPIRKVNSRHDELDVYNLEVEEDESYIAGVVVHNCSGCGHEARSRREYCRGPRCKYGGLYDNIGKTFADGHHLHADNPDPDWFDISHIVGGRGADRTSFTLGLVKRASEKVACGAQLADEMGLAIPFLPDLFGPAVAAHAKVACELTARDPSDFATAAAFSPTASLPLPPGGVAKAAVAFRALADARVVLPVRAFLELAGVAAKEAAAAAPAVAAAVPDAYAAILADGDAGLAANPFLPAASADSAHRKWAASLAAAASLEPAAVSRRLSLAAVRDAAYGRRDVRTTVATPAAADAARAYALYKIAALAAVPDEARRPLMTAARAQDVATA